VGDYNEIQGQSGCTTCPSGQNNTLKGSTSCYKLKPPSQNQQSNVWYIVGIILLVIAIVIIIVAILFIVFKKREQRQKQHEIEEIKKIMQGISEGS